MTHISYVKYNKPGNFTVYIFYKGNKVLLQFKGNEKK